VTAASKALARLEARVHGYGAGSAAVAFSGGVDSSLVLAVAARALGSSRVAAVTALSPSYPSGELTRARRVAGALGVAFRTVETEEVERADYARNDALRCFHCKTELYSVLETLIAPGAVVLAGANADDADDFRPGFRAAGQHGVRNPLLEEGLGKEAVREAAHALGLETADKPAMACLSSRVAFGVPITPELLRRIDRAESRVRALGFGTVRVRHHGGRAAIEVERDQVPRLEEDPRLPKLVRDLRGMGWAEVTIDPDGYRPGAMNATLVELSPARRRPPSAAPQEASPALEPGAARPRRPTAPRR